MARNDKKRHTNGKNRSWELYLSIKQNDFEQTKRLLAMGNKNLHFQKESCLATAIKSGSAEMIKLLLDCNIDPQIRSLENGRNEAALLTAVRWKNLQIVKLLINHGAGILTTAFYGYDAIFQAVIESAHEILEYLLENMGQRSLRHEIKNCPFLLALKYAVDYFGKRMCLLTLIRHQFHCSCLQTTKSIISMHYSSLQTLQDVKDFYLINSLKQTNRTNTSHQLVILILERLSLMNLARHAICKSINSANSKVQLPFSEKLNQLPIPQKLKAFLLYRYKNYFECTKVIFRRSTGDNPDNIYYIILK